jgi:3-methylfumaryl-CoA hydratase
MTNTPNLHDWIGREIAAQDCLNVQSARFMQATLDQDPTVRAGDALPPLWHWLYFREAQRASDLGRDAHSKRGGFLPPVTLPRRMWAGGRFTFINPLILGQDAEKRSTIKDVQQKTGRSGRLCFVTVEHRISQGDRHALSEEHDIVYREDPDPTAPAPAVAPAPQNPGFSERITPTEVMLFRYSALTFNGHRIHYDVDYARDVEGYAGLVFHGPLTATLLMDLACRQTGAAPKRFEFRGLAPIAGPAPFLIEGKMQKDHVELWAKRYDGALAMTATAHF